MYTEFYSYLSVEVVLFMWCTPDIVKQNTPLQSVGTGEGTRRGSTLQHLGNRVFLNLKGLAGNPNEPQNKPRRTEKIKLALFVALLTGKLYYSWEFDRYRKCSYFCFVFQRFLNWPLTCTNVCGRPERQCFYEINCHVPWMNIAHANAYPED